MKPLLLAFVLLLSVAGQAQTAHRNPYLVVRLQEKKDDFKKGTYWAIAAESGHPNATPLYQLHPYATKGSAPEGTAFFDPGENAGYGQRAPYYNYFPSATAALNFLAQQGWRLLQVFPETKSIRVLSLQNEWYTDVTSSPVYYFTWHTFGN